MGELEDVLGVVESIHAASIDPGKWTIALSNIAELIGGHGASFEVLSVPEARHTIFHGAGLPAVDAYLNHYAPLTRRIPYSIRHKAGTVFHEGMFIGEDEIGRDPFYMEFLAPYDMRYFLGGVVYNSATTNVLAGVQRSPRQGLPSDRERTLFACLMPHLQQAYDVIQRLDGAAMRLEALDGALSWLTDGVLAVDGTGSVLHANTAAEEMARGTALAIRAGALIFSAPDADRAFQQALATVLIGGTPIDFVAAQRGDLPPYAVSVRPLSLATGSPARVLVFIHDPSRDHSEGPELLRAAFGLTATEARVADALRQGTTPEAYAEQARVSVNTVYTHIRHIKDKCGRSRTVELIRLLNSVRSITRAI